MTSTERSRQPSAGVATRDRRLREVRHEIHVAGWVLALVRIAGSTRASVRGSREAALEVPRREGADGRARLGPEQLRLPGGRVPHDFLRTDETGRRTEVERFDSLRPDAIVEIAAAGAAEAGAGSSRQSELSLDVIVERDDRPLAGRAVAKLERYEHFLAGWSVDTERYGRRRRASPLVVFVCRDRARARANARSADPLLRACRAYAGEYPFDWDYLARKEIVFAAERDLHEGVPLAYGVPTLPPDVRVAVAKGDPRAGESMAEPREILPVGPERDG